MKISLSFAAKNPQFLKKIRRIRSDFEDFFDDFSLVDLTNPIHEAILIGVTDSRGDDFFEIIKNRDGYFQTLAGLDGFDDDAVLRKKLFLIVSKSILACPFSNPDRGKFHILLKKWEGEIMKN